MTLNLKTEIEKINQGCGKRFEISENRLAICGKYYYDEKEQTLCPTCQAEISALKKGISACEEALSQRNKEILEIIDKLKIKHTKEHRGCGDPSECCFNRLDVLGWDFFKDLKQQLTTEGEGKK